ncbi:MAG: 4Fe-4S binding protein [Eubacteriaceae bacterium]|jgi:2-oxoglutarate ferredoxin oxidoreductase subunit delta|nr:4Fe-4S binding protein [Eubacteriaceae bacterium]
MEKISIDVSRCKGCGYCICVCPSGAITKSEEVSKKGYTVISVDESKCVQCGSCYKMCPDYVFQIF